MTQPAPKPRSHTLIDGANRAGARAMLRASGLRDEDFAKPLVGVANTWIEIGPCNYHLRELAVHVKAGIRAAGGTPLEFNTVSISDGITMGTEGMRTSLVSREVIADSIELVSRGNLFDALIVLVGCDKTIPGGVMSLARLDIPGLILYGGSIAPGHFEGHAVTIQDVYEAIGKHARGGITDAQLKSLETAACPGAGACGGQFTANTMALVCEFLGIAPMGLSSVPATNAAKGNAGYRAGEMVMDLLRRDITPSKIITKSAIENAIAGVAATGGWPLCSYRSLRRRRHCARGQAHARRQISSWGKSHRNRAHARGGSSRSEGIGQTRSCTQARFSPQTHGRTGDLEGQYRLGRLRH